jgi:hypothetical protein
MSPEDILFLKEKEKLDKEKLIKEDKIKKLELINQ